MHIVLCLTKTFIPFGSFLRLIWILFYLGIGLLYFLHTNQSMSDDDSCIFPLFAFSAIFKIK